MKSNIINETISFIKAHLQDNITSDSLANHVGYSKYHLARLFKTQTGLTPFEYIRRERLIMAAKTIRYGNDKVCNVAFDFVFDTHEGFTRAFANMFGISPRKFAATLQPYEWISLSNNSTRRKNNIKTEGNMNILNLSKPYEIGLLKPGEYQYADRNYQFSYIPEPLNGLTHIKVNANDKMLFENQEMFSFETDTETEVYVLYADKFPVIPTWLDDYERTRLNVTRMDTDANTLKGYFGVYRKHFNAGKITLYGCSPNIFAEEEWYNSTNAGGYCCYSVCVRKV